MQTIRSTKPIARKQHKCDWCELPILIGDKYENSTNEHDGNIYTWKNHISCGKIATELKMFDGVWDEGLTGEDFQECIKEEFSHLMAITDGDDDETPSFEYRLNFVKNYHSAKKYQRSDSLTHNMVI